MLAISGPCQPLEAQQWYGKCVDVIHRHPVILQLAGDKAFCYRLFARAGLPVPDHEVYRLKEFYKVERFMQTQADQLLVVKPAKGTSGARGITTHLRNLRECRRASALASLYSDKIIVERWIPGESYRLLVLDGRTIHATRRGDYDSLETGN